MIVYEELEQKLKDGITRKLIITKSVDKNNELFKQLIQKPTNIIYHSGEVVDVGHLQNGLPIYDNGYTYEESEEFIEGEL